ncbi:hypothetical protein F2Q70_00023021 [Brassica cretica]|uniref:Uncharacterized protein n=1 Tax=Brassica cretica TaxID=69181 RepID=A0A8S9GP97_BRACR|nr:hypothetical protein F2Q70_00023021 [Brassica cretica]
MVQLFIGTSTVERITLILPNTFSTLFGLVSSKSSLYGCHNAYGVYVSSHIFPARIHIFTSVGFSSSTMGALRTRFAPILVSASAMSGEENAVELKIGDGNLSVIPVFAKCLMKCEVGLGRIRISGKFGVPGSGSGSVGSVNLISGFGFVVSGYPDFGYPSRYCITRGYPDPDPDPPNMITLMGFMFLVTSSLLGYIYSPQLDSPPPRWVHFEHGSLLFLYQTFDAVDGKQARRTNSSSPLGELFDHASAMSGEENAVELKIGDGNLSVIPVFVSPAIVLQN